MQNKKKELIAIMAQNAMALMQMGRLEGDKDLMLMAEASMLAVAAIRLNRQKELNDFLQAFKDLTEPEVMERLRNMNPDEMFKELPPEVRDLLIKARNEMAQDHILKQELPDAIKDALKDTGINFSNN